MLSLLSQEWPRYLHNKRAQKKINESQYEYLLSTGLYQMDQLSLGCGTNQLSEQLGAEAPSRSVSCPAVLDHLLREFQLVEDFHQYLEKLEEERKQQQLGHMHLQKQMADLQGHVSRLQSQLTDLQRENEPINRELSHWKNRLQQFPENRNFQVKMEQLEQQLHPETQLKDEIDVLQTQLAEQTALLEYCL